MNRETTDAIKFILENPNEDDYIQEHFSQFINMGEADDNSVSLYEKWQDNFKIILKFLKNLKNENKN